MRCELQRVSALDFLYQVASTIPNAVLNGNKRQSKLGLLFDDTNVHNITLVLSGVGPHHCGLQARQQEDPSHPH